MILSCAHILEVALAVVLAHFIMLVIEIIYKLIMGED